MLIVKLKGGLGNQMFQYAFARRLSVENKCEVKLDSENGFTNDFFERHFNLGSYNIILVQAEKEDLNKYNYYYKSIPGRIIQKASKLFPNSRGYIETEKVHYSYQENIILDSGDRYYDGYWQNVKYFKSIRKILLQEFTLKNKYDTETNLLINELAGNNSVAVHIRSPHAFVNGRTHKEALSRFVILNDKYYKKAYSYIDAKIKTPKYYLFCEDENYASTLLREVPIERIIKSTDYIELILMSKCKHQIISNSTFSWWAAWLNDNPDKIVISPKDWYTSKSNISDALLNNYMLIS